MKKRDPRKQIYIPEVTFELSLPLDEPLQLVVNRAIENVNKICEAYQEKSTLRILVKITN